MNILTSVRFGKLLQHALTGSGVAVLLLTALQSSAGIQGSGRFNLVALGTVTASGAGSIVVSGKPYSTSFATFKVDGHLGKQGDIQVGDVVSLVASSTGTDGSYAASEVTYSGSVRGRITGIDPQAGTFVVLGQTVRVESNTLFDSGRAASGLAGLSPGDTVEVSAYANSVGDLVASRIHAKGHSQLARVVGSLHSLDPTQHTFYINSLQVDYGGASVRGGLTEGALVTVQGYRLGADGALLADVVRAQPAIQVQPGALGRIQGLITGVSSSAYFEVAGQPVIINSATQLKLPVPIGLDVAVQVSGTFDANGALVADSVQTSK
jgi:hypothetical protein